MYPYLIYGNLIWGNASATALWPILKLQKMAIRIITDTPSSKSTLSLCHKLRILRLLEIYSYSTTIFMYKYKNNMMPSSLNYLFQTNNFIHHYNTRGASCLRAPRVKTLMAEKFITCTGAKYWNYFSSRIDPTVKIGTFKQQVISHLLHNYLK